MRRSHFALALSVASVLLMLPSAANAKEAFDHFRVVTPTGKVGLVRGQAAEAWWHDYMSPGTRGCRCTTAAAAVRYSRGLFRRFSTSMAEFPAGHAAWLLSGVSHWGPMVYYPPAQGASGVVLTPGARGPRGWRFQWEVASPRMQNILRLALRRGTVSTYAGSSGAFPTGLAIGGGIGALLLLLLLGLTLRAPFLERRRVQQSLSRSM